MRYIVYDHLMRYNMVSAYKHRLLIHFLSLRPEGPVRLKHQHRKAIAFRTAVNSWDFPSGKKPAIEALAENKS